MIFFTACETDFAGYEVHSPPDLNLLDCLHNDCATGTNSLVEVNSFSKKSEVPLLGIQRAYYGQHATAEHLNRFQSDGYPAWNALLNTSVSENYQHYLVPVYKTTSDKVEAVISVIHYLGYGTARIDYLDRDEIGSFISFYDSVLSSKHKDSLGGDRYTLEGVASVFLSLDKRLFGEYGADISETLSEEARAVFFAKDCHVTTHYIQETVWYTYNDGTLVDTDITYTFTSSTTYSDDPEIGCGGGTVPGNPGTGGPNGGGTGGGVIPGVSGPGVIVITTDPNNRCVEDGVGCEEEEEEENEALPRISNKISPDDFPCAHAIVNEIFGGVNPSDEILAELINDIFAVEGSTSNLLFVTHPDAATLSGNPGELVAGFYVQQGSGTDGNGNIAISGTIFLDEDFISCTNDFTRALILHESLHAYIDYFAETMSEEEFPLTAMTLSEEHSLMAEQYASSIEGALHHYNPGIGDGVATWLAWSGLEGTPAYNAYVAEFAEENGRTIEEMDAIINSVVRGASNNCEEGWPDGTTLENFNLERCQ